MLNIFATGKFKKDYKLAGKRGLNISLLTEVIEKLQRQEPLEAKYKDHALTPSKDYINCRECHIQLDWLLVYRIDNNELMLELLRTGSHSDLF